MSHPASHPTSHPAAHPASHPAAAPLAPQVAPQPISAEVRAALRERLAANPGIILEQLAGMNGCAVGEVIECLPEGMWWRESGERFIEIMHAVAAWQTPVTLITHSADAILEWLPQETIVFDGARSRMDTRVQLGAGSRYFGWEILCLGRSASGERRGDDLVVDDGDRVG